MAEIEAGRVDEALVDRALRRVLAQKLELGLLDAGWSPEPLDDGIDLDSAGNRDIARRLAESSIVLLDNRPDCCLCRPRSGLRCSGRAPTTRRRSSAATPSPIT